MKSYNLGDTVKFYYNGEVCEGTVVKIDRDVYTVNFVYKETGKAPVNVMYDVTEIELLK